MRAIKKMLWGCWYLIWSCVPGCGQMCLGYMKRGISQMIIFCALTFIAVFLEMGALTVLVAPLWAYSFFDSFNLRRQLRNGGAPEDEFLFGLSDMDARKLSRILARRGSLIGWLLVAVGLYSLYMILARNILYPLRESFPIFDWLYDLLVWDMPRILGSVLILGLGLWFIRGPKAHIEDDESYTPPSSSEPPPKMDPTPWTEAEAKVHSQPEPQAPGAEPTPVTFQWKSEFEVEKFEENGEKEE